MLKLIKIPIKIDNCSLEIQVSFYSSLVCNNYLLMFYKYKIKLIILKLIILYNIIFNIKK